MSLKKLVFVVIVVCLALGATNSPMASATVTCGQVGSSLSPCVGYLLNGGNSVPSQCCNGIRNLYGLAQNTPDRQTVCNCIKDAVNSSGFAYTGYNLNLAAGLPKKCGVNIPYQISPTTDCSRVH